MIMSRLFALLAALFYSGIILALLYGAAYALYPYLAAYPISFGLFILGAGVLGVFGVILVFMLTFCFISPGFDADCEDQDHPHIN